VLESPASHGRFSSAPLRIGVVCVLLWGFAATAAAATLSPTSEPASSPAPDVGVSSPPVESGLAPTQPVGSELPSSSTETSAADPRFTAEPPANWETVLVAWAEHPLRARLFWRQGKLALEEGRRSPALDRLESAVAEDPDFAGAWWTLARVHLSQGNPMVVQDAVEGFKASLHGYRSQSRWAARLLLGIDLVLAGAFLWIVLILLLRYLPFLHHQLASWLQPGHREQGVAWMLWIPALAVFALRLGVIPLLCLAVVMIWLYGGRRERIVLSAFVLFFAIQGLDGGLLSTPLVGVRETSTASLSWRAAHDTPSTSLAAQLEEAIANDPENADLLFARAMLKAHRGQFEASSLDFQKVLSLRGDDAKAVNNLAGNHYFRGNYDRAVAGFQRSASIDSLQGSTWYNLAQSYIKKLFFKEGGEYMQRASQLGFELGSSARRLPTGAVYYQAPSAGETWAMAWHERGSLQPYDLLVPWRRWLGVPPDAIPAWLVVTLLLSLVLFKVFSRERLVYECSNCGKLACQRCSGEHEGSILCPTCTTTAQRARSEMVLSTLLRNRRRAAEYAFHSKVRRLNAWAIGAGDLYNGLRKRGLLLTLFAWTCVYGIVLPQGLLPSPWAPVTVTPLLALPRILSFAGLLLLFLISRYGRTSWRSRSFLLHPSSMVKFSDLLENRVDNKLKA